MHLFRYSKESVWLFSPNKHSVVTVTGLVNGGQPWLHSTVLFIIHWSSISAPAVWVQVPIDWVSSRGIISDTDSNSCSSICLYTNRAIQISGTTQDLSTWQCYEAFFHLCFDFTSVKREKTIRQNFSECQVLNAKLWHSETKSLPSN